MKKFLYFWGILALIAVFVTSCNKDEDENNEPKTAVQKKLIKKVDDAGGDDEDVTVYTYDSDGRCISETLYGKDLVYNRITYKYDTNKIIKESYRKEDNSLIDTAIITLDPNGFIDSYEAISSSSKYLSKYEYDEKGQLISEKNYYGDMILSNYRLYEWDNGNIVKEKYHEENLDFEVSYKNTNSLHKSPIVNNLSLNIFPYLRINPISNKYKYGVSVKNLPVSLIEKDDEELIEWTFDTDGYLIRVANVYDSIEEYVIKYVWE